MNAIIATLLTALLLSTAPVDAASPSDPKAEKEVMAAMEAWQTAMMKKDGAALAKLYHEDLSYGHSSGIVENKAEAVNHIVTTKVDYAAVDFVDTKIKVLGTPQGWQMIGRQSTRDGSQ